MKIKIKKKIEKKLKEIDEEWATKVFKFEPHKTIKKIKISKKKKRKFFLNQYRLKVSEKEGVLRLKFHNQKMFKIKTKKKMRVIKMTMKEKIIMKKI